MLQIAHIQAHKEEVIAALQKRHFSKAAELVEKAISIDNERKSTQSSLNELQASANEVAKSIGALMQQGKKEEANLAKQKAAQNKQTVKELEDKFKELENNLINCLYEIPNIPHKDVVAGKSAEDNQTIEEWGTPPTLTDDAVPHWELIKKYDIVDFELGVKITGAGFPVYKGKGARLQRSLINYFLDEAIAAGYNEVQPPILINEASGYGTGQLPDKEGQMYEATADQLFLIPTAEVPLTNLYRNEIVKESDFPIKMTAHTPCFRREAGSWGADVRGLNRLHQFDKVELVVIEHPEKSYQRLENMLSHVKGLLEALELPYRVLRLCGGDTGFTSALTYDLEVYSAAQGRWLEVSSVSNFETFQSNRLKLRYEDKDKKKHLTHTLNGSALALPRILAAILENNQTAEGIKIPKVLQDYCKFERID
ncbi:seryl-tRNA synthetase [Bernardetia litoralis DSM 6794]|uniref:Serine--tRNA ligase n=1 Tax=Bernardetia litoralis (strain ATCC 23117 / DSM 6794 / NBRC 15988 / NCIMB 1366 / Fx l1 / Sio-4) TaxID=880071 RepID=I4AQ89_BERLS|nr:serine--tRNA ligase [Bernardetia litoralis]AFM06124.1 seryl-tRNA synthetase [Bernardetia litoralis DSM 6794]